MAHEFINLIVIIAGIAVVLFFAKAKNLEYGLFFVHLALVFIANGWLMHPGYMVDQIRYLFVTQNIINHVKLADYNLDDSTIWFTSHFFAYFPLPYIESCFSLGMINVFVFSLIYFFLKINKILLHKSLWFFLLYPSMMFYTSLALRETLILLFMFLGAFFVIQKRPVTAVLFSLPLYLIKFQNLLIFLVALALQTLLSRGVHLYKKIAILAFSCLMVYRHKDWLTIGGINHIIREMNIAATDHPLQVASHGAVLQTSLTNFFSFLLEPFLWNAANSFQFAQSIENMIVFSLIVAVVAKLFKRIPTEQSLIFLTVYFTIAVLVHAPFVTNYGTIARYRFPFIAIFLTYMYHFEDKNGEHEATS
ncbi:MAG: hypothetical protein HQL63_12185 [Magnetococcales bacterium]|nr:hypothetical protein [Magnetococcales bacterium]MBF0321823.1 hypothetical protein [Magnetococcales bacterium]